MNCECDPCAAGVFTSANVGERAASRVRVAAPQGSRFDGLTGVVVRAVHESGTVMVRFERDGATLPFALGELEVVA